MGTADVIHLHEGFSERENRRKISTKRREFAEDMKELFAASGVNSRPERGSV